jgi:hypothetical protein
MYSSTHSLTSALDRGEWSSSRSGCFIPIKDIYRGIKQFKNGYQPRIKLVKDENSELLAYPHNILNRCKCYFCQMFNVHSVNDVRYT